MDIRGYYAQFILCAHNQRLKNYDDAPRVGY